MIASNVTNLFQNASFNQWSNQTNQCDKIRMCKLGFKNKHYFLFNLLMIFSHYICTHDAVL